MNRGIPGIAVSADTSEKNPDLVADIVVDLVSKLIRRNGLALPSQNGLNVNVANTKGFTSVADFEYRQTKIGLAGSVGLLFVDNLGDNCPIAAAYGLPKLPYSGMCLASPFTAAGYPEDNDISSENNAILSGPIVSLSAIQGTYQASAAVEKEIFGTLEII
jgi:hypothetical protein